MQEKLPDVDTQMVWILLEAVVLEKNNITKGSSKTRWNDVGSKKWPSSKYSNGQTKNQTHISPGA